MSRALRRLTGLAVGAALGGLIFAWSGLYNVAATAGHWPPTAWLLRLAMRSSVETHSLSLAAPALDRPALIERGAGHYETGCAPCHGAPGSPSNRIPNSMLPQPPFLSTRVESWTPEQLFWIVKHGLKYTGMPAWPAQARDDEVWAVTAFLLRLPGMSAERYAELAKGGIQASAPAADGPPLPERPGELFSMTDAALIGACVRCHGIDGSGRPSGAFPRLDMQGPEYLARALDEYASGVRPSGIMQPIAAALENQQIERLASFYAEAALLRRTEAEGAPPDVIDRGRRIATEGVPGKAVAACVTCHGLEGGPENPLFPALNGQYAAYAVAQLQLWKEGKRGGGPYSDIMAAAMRDISPQEIEAVAGFYESLAAQPGMLEAQAPIAPMR